MKPKTTEQGERMLASMYANLSSAHRCLAMACAYERDGLLDDAERIRAQAEAYFDAAEQVGSDALGGKVHVARYTVDGIELANKIVHAWQDNPSSFDRLDAMLDLVRVAQDLLSEVRAVL